MVHLDEHYVDPRLVALYDIENPRGDDTDFYLRLALELDARIVIDLGCGTGLLTREMAGDGRQVFGVDPSPAMLAWARRQTGADQVQWIEGDAGVLGNRNADLLVMTGNVAQVFLEDSEWRSTLSEIHATLRPGGYLAFESRNPAARAWEHWNREASYVRYDSPFGRMETWIELVSVGDGRVGFEGHNVFAATGEVVVVKSELRFRTLSEMSSTLIDAGFAIDRVYGDWHKGPLRSTSHVMIFVARRK